MKYLKGCPLLYFAYRKSHLVVNSQFSSVIQTEIWKYEFRKVLVNQRQKNIKTRKWQVSDGWEVIFTFWFITTMKLIHRRSKWNPRQTDIVFNAIRRALYSTNNKIVSSFSLIFLSVFLFIFILLSSFYFVSSFVMKLSNMQANVFTLIIYIVYVVSLIKNPKI